MQLRPTTTLTNCTISGNSAAGSGGGLFNGYHYGTTTLTNCTVSGNSATGNGGGLYNATDGTTTLTNCTVSGNSAVGGGGISNQGTLNVASTNITKNRPTAAPAAMAWAAAS